MLRHRLPTGIALIAGLILVMWADAAVARLGWMPGTVLFAMLLLPFVVLAAREVEPILRGVERPGDARSIAVGGIAGLTVVGLAAWLRFAAAPDPSLWVVAVPAVIPVVFAWGMIWAGRKRQSATGLVSHMLSLGFGFLFLGLPAGAWLGLRVLESPAVLAAAVLTVKSCDIGAYFTGRLVGRHKWIPWLSPGKTWEGLAGGLVVSAGVAWATAGGLGVAAGRPTAVILLAGAVLGLAGQLGDLFASAMKRDAGVKDFATTIPGFGGVLDVTDSLLMTGPLVFALFLWAES